MLCSKIACDREGWYGFFCRQIKYCADRDDPTGAGKCQRPEAPFEACAREFRANLPAASECCIRPPIGVITDQVESRPLELTTTIRPSGCSKRSPASLVMTFPASPNVLSRPPSAL